MSPVALVVDTDGGTDDAVALWWALADPRVELVAIVVTAGVVGRDAAATNVLRILHAAQRGDIPVALGATGVGGERLTAHGVDGTDLFGRNRPAGDLGSVETPAGYRPTAPGADGPVGLGGFGRGRGVGDLGQVETVGGDRLTAHGVDGLGGFGRGWGVGDLRPVETAGGELLCELAAGRTGELDLVAIGPLSTLAGALALEPGLARRVRSLTVLGGAGDTNTTLDPDAAAAVRGAAWGRAPRVVGLDVTLRTLLHDEDLELAAEGRTAAARFVAGPLRAYADECVRRGRVPAGRCPVHDLVAVIAAVDPSFVPTDEQRLRREFASLVSV